MGRKKLVLSFFQNKNDAVSLPSVRLTHKNIREGKSKSNSIDLGCQCGGNGCLNVTEPQNFPIDSKTSQTENKFKS